MADLFKVMERECLHSEHAAQCFLEAKRRDKARIKVVAQERIDLLRRKYEAGEWTQAEQARFDELNAEMNRLSPRVTPEMFESLKTPNGPLQGRAACGESLGSGGSASAGQEKGQ